MSGRNRPCYPHRDNRPARGRERPGRRDVQNAALVGNYHNFTKLFWRMMCRHLPKRRLSGRPRCCIGRPISWLILRGVTVTEGATANQGVDQTGAIPSAPHHPTWKIVNWRASPALPRLRPPSSDGQGGFLRARLGTARAPKLGGT